MDRQIPPQMRYSQSRTEAIPLCRFLNSLGGSLRRCEGERSG